MQLDINSPLKSIADVDVGSLILWRHKQVGVVCRKSERQICVLSFNDWYVKLVYGEMYEACEELYSVMDLGRDFVLKAEEAPVLLADNKPIVPGNIVMTDKGLPIAVRDRANQSITNILRVNDYNSTILHNFYDNCAVVARWSVYVPRSPTVLGDTHMRVFEV